jgi:hypothetical protein
LNKAGKWLVVTVNLGDSKYVLAEDRLRDQIDDFAPLFDLVVVNNSNLATFAPRTVEKYSTLLRNDVPGFGFWVWKAEICSKMLKICESSGYEGCVYLDVGCELYSSYISKKVLKMLLLLAKTREALIFSSGGTDLQYSKKHLIQELNASKNHIQSKQIAATWFIITPTNSQSLVEEWMELCLRSESLLNLDYVEPSLNFDGFVSHRSDQSILSLISKRRGIKPVPHLDYSGRNMRFHFFRKQFHPIWTSRNLSEVKLDVISTKSRESET